MSRKRFITAALSLSAANRLVRAWHLLCGKVRVAVDRWRWEYPA